MQNALQQNQWYNTSTMHAPQWQVRNRDFTASGFKRELKLWNIVIEKMHIWSNFTMKPCSNYHGHKIRNHNAYSNSNGYESGMVAL